MAKSIFAGAVEPEFEGWLRCTLASIGEAVLDLVLSQAMKPQAIANTRISVEPRIDACYSSRVGNGNEDATAMMQLTGRSRMIRDD